jgi:hypothetical protein
VHIRTLSLVEIPMLHTLARSFFSQTKQQATPVRHEAKCIDPAQLKLVAGGLPRGGWLEPEAMATAQLPRGGWC